MEEGELFTRSLSNVDRAKLFEQEVRSRLGVALSVSATTPLKANMAVVERGRIKVANFHFSPHRTKFRAIRHGLGRKLLVILPRQGTAVLDQIGRKPVMAPGTICLVDTSWPFEIVTEATETRTIYFARDAVRSVCPDLEYLTGIPICALTGPGALFRALVDELYAVGESLSEDSADEVADTLPQLLGTALRTIKIDGESLPARIQILNRERVRRYALDNLADPNLSIGLIGQALNMSVRSVYQLFSDQPETLMRWI